MSHARHRDTLAHKYTRTERTVGKYAVTIDGEKKPKPSKWFYFILKLNGVARERHNHFTNSVSTLFAQCWKLNRIDRIEFIGKCNFFWYCVCGLTFKKPRSVCTNVYIVGIYKYKQPQQPAAAQHSSTDGAVCLCEKCFFLFFSLFLLSWR